MANVLLIDPTFAESSYLQQKDCYPHAGLLTMGTLLKAAGHNVQIIHMLSDGIDLEKLPLVVKCFKPDIVGITMVTFQLAYARQVAQAVKGVSQNIKVICGGPHPSAVGHVDGFDYTIRGEGELPMLDIAKGESHFKPYPPMDVDKLPPLDLSLVDLSHFAGIYPPGPMPSMPLMFSRGCPFHCKFCSKSVFGDKVRFRKVNLVIEDLKRMVDCGVREIFFQDDTFNTNLDYCYELLDGILSAGLNQKLWFRARLRANEKLITWGLLTQMKRAGFWNIFYGVECGNQDMLDKAIGKQLTIAEIKRAFTMTHEAGIKTEASFIIGMPGETKETIRDSFNLYRELKSDWCSFNRAIPFPGTAFYYEAKHKGHLLCENYEDYRLNKTLVRTEALTADELESYAVEADNMILKQKLRYNLTHPAVWMSAGKDVLSNPGHALKRTIGLVR